MVWSADQFRLVMTVHSFRESIVEMVADGPNGGDSTDLPCGTARQHVHPERVDYLRPVFGLSQSSRIYPQPPVTNFERQSIKTSPDGVRALYFCQANSEQVAEHLEKKHTFSISAGSPLPSTRLRQAGDLLKALNSCSGAVRKNLFPLTQSSAAVRTLWLIITSSRDLSTPAAQLAGLRNWELLGNPTTTALHRCGLD